MYSLPNHDSVVNCIHIHCAVSNTGFLVVLCGLVWYSLINCLASESFVVFFSLETENLREEILRFYQADNLWFSFSMYCYTYRQLTLRNLEFSEFSFLCTSTKRKSLKDTFGIFHNNSCLFELIKLPSMHYCYIIIPMRLVLGLIRQSFLLLWIWQILLKTIFNL